MKIYSSKHTLNDTQLLHKYLGKDVWILADNDYWFSPKYIRLLRLVDGRLCYNCFWNGDFDYFRANPERLEDYLATPYFASIKDIHVVYPLDLLTTEDVFELMGVHE